MKLRNGVSNKELTAGAVLGIVHFTELNILDSL